MNSSIPLISVGLPVYNGEKYLRSSIDSILAQTFDDFELIISDNASTDGTENICREYADRDARIQYFRNEKNLGAAGNYNILVEKARAKYFRWQNADDYIEPNLHELCFKILEKNPDCVLTFGKTKVIDAEGDLIEKYEDNLHIVDERAADRFVRFKKNVGQTNAIYGLMRLNALRKTHLFRKFKSSDTNFMGELCLYGKFIQIPEYLFYRRMHEGASSWDRKNTKVQRDFWDPSAEAFNYQHIKKHFAYYSDVLKGNIPISDKIRILIFLLRNTRHSRHHLWNDLIYSLKNKI